MIEDYKTERLDETFSEMPLDPTLLYEEDDEDSVDGNGVGHHHHNTQDHTSS